MVWALLIYFPYPPPFHSPSVHCALFFSHLTSSLCVPSTPPCPKALPIHSFRMALSFFKHCSNYPYCDTQHTVNRIGFGVYVYVCMCVFSSGILAWCIWQVCLHSAGSQVPQDPLLVFSSMCVLAGFQRHPSVLALLAKGFKGSGFHSGFLQLVDITLLQQIHGGCMIN